MIERLSWALDEKDSLVALGLIVEARDALRNVEVTCVNEARRAGYTWAQIAQWCGLRTRQAAYQRWARSNGD